MDLLGVLQEINRQTNDAGQPTDLQIGTVTKAPPDDDELEIQISEAMARIMLALKNVLAENDHVGSLVFDEVDTGVSGRAAQKVAEKLAGVARTKQVLCVTHLPQLAAMADVHFSVEKGERKGRTFTEVERLSRERRMEELARLTSGERITGATLEAAGELLDSAERFKRALTQQK